MLVCRRLVLVDDALIGNGLDLRFRILAMQSSMVKSTSTKSVETRQP